LTIKQNKRHKKKGALLSVVWEEGQVTTYPLYFTSATTTNNNNKRP
jgi:hypothetical protein